MNWFRHQQLTGRYTCAIELPVIESKGSNLNSQVREVKPDLIGFHRMKIRNG